MSRSQNAVELCALLVDETYGELTSRIFIILLRRGKLPISEISRHTRLGPKATRNGLAVLIQQNLVYYHTGKTGSTFYEANDGAAYALARSGKVIEFVESRYGAFARDVVQNLFLFGHTKVSDLAEAYASQQKQAAKGKSNGHSAANGVNGHTNGNIGSGAHMDGLLVELLELGLIEPVVQRMFRNPADIKDELEADITTNEIAGGSIKGSSKKKEQLHGILDERLKRIEAEDREWRSKVLKKPLNGVLTNGVNGSSKKRRLSHGSSSIGDHNYEDDGTRLDVGYLSFLKQNENPNLVVRINHEKCAVLLRNAQLVEAVKKKLGDTTSQIYAELLKHLEKKIPKCAHGATEDEYQDRPLVSTRDVATSLSKSVNVSLGIGKTIGEGPKSGELAGPKLGSPPVNRKRKAGDLEGSGSENEDDPPINGNGNSHEVDQDGDDVFADAPAVKSPKRPKVTFQDKLPEPEGLHSREDRIYHVKEHMALLADDQYGFVTREADGQAPEAEIDKLVLELFGAAGHRLVRMLRQLGKLDEKHLKDTTLMKQKDIRTKLAEMQLSGWVDIQEVPKDASRGANNNRVIFLWFFDNERCSSLVLDHTYKSMSRLLHRLNVERRRAKSVLELTHRSDVRDKPPDEYLMPAQLNELHAFQDREDMLLGQLGRLDEIVGIFKDY
ncbi:DNA-directed RNA polymerase III subunit [Lachnellula hyalina]|uniref:DNA-directed RNA polymerase III subunit RPC3 n=1 Tax=Lachnellula hyalina TaxID=1316788 RepID=A0A8H8QW62_9HELO|nr:DNA-directed RNA polymerase III subunit [Lachnellula hyalina]TVY23864.1 DNA-directed RNA polymerase III subunit [Lachnellula hyalina]